MIPYNSAVPLQSSSITWLDVCELVFPVCVISVLNVLLTVITCLSVITEGPYNLDRFLSAL